MISITKKLSLSRYVLLAVSMLICVVSAPRAYGTSTGPIQYFSFTASDSLAGWNEKVLNGKVVYSLEHDGADGFVRAVSDRSSSALYKQVKVNIKKTPFISWQWQAVAFPALSGEDTPEDFVARVYVIFPSFSFSRSRFLEYVWDTSLPVESILSTPSANIKRIVAHSGVLGVNQWITEERNVFDDYCRAFGSSPRLKVRAVAVMSDSDDTASYAEALFDEIKIGYAHE